MIDHRTRLKELLRELFQFDTADLDFGIYRIMNQRRTEIEEFIEHGLLDIVGQELNVIQVGAVAQKQTELDQQRIEVIHALGEAAFEPSGEITDAYRQIPLALRFIQKQEEVQRTVISAEIEAEIFNALYTFFSRYYDEGDFITQRRYSRQPKYAVPYNGEEVLLHWANRDQFYVKTADVLTDYAFRIDASGSYRVAFKLAAADTEQNNVKEQKRYFLPAPDPMADFNAGQCELTLFFVYRPLTEPEVAEFGKTNVQVKIIAARRDVLLAAVPDATLRGLLANMPVGKEVSLLEMHLARWTRKSTSDYFIHKDLKGFLERELDFYLKNEIMRLDDVDSAQETQVQDYLTRLKVIRRIAHKIIAFLAQIEDFQKRLFEKPKFILRSDWCVTLDRLPEALYEQVAANPRQWEQWEALGIPVPPTAERSIGYLSGHPSLMVDTALYDTEFKDALLAALSKREGGLDAQRDGLLIHGENYQALRLLQPVYTGMVKCIYIDPPYNTGNDGFVYKDSFQHSTWLTMMKDRLRLAQELLTDDGIILISINDNEFHRLQALCLEVFGANNFLSYLVWKSRQNVDSRALKNISNDHEFIIAYGRMFRGALKDETKYSNPDNDTRGPWMSDNMVGLRNKQDRPNLHYDIMVGLIKEFPDQLVGDWRIGEYKVIAKGTTGLSQEIGAFQNGEYVFALGNSDDAGNFIASYIGVMGYLSDGLPRPSNIYPCTDKGWRYEPATMAKKIFDNRILWPSSPLGRPRKKTYLRELKSSFTGFSSVVGYTRDGTSELKSLFGEEVVSFPKPSDLISRLLQQASDVDSTIIDFFAGSGTTAHAVINLNNDTEGELSDRKYLLVEQANYFYTVIKPRLQKVVYTAEWKDSKPVAGSPGTSHVFEYLVLESYEDTLDNLDLDLAAAPQLGLFPPERDDYLLRYFLDHETRQARLTLPIFDHPFEAAIRVWRDGIEQRLPIDLVETANFLLGLTVIERRTFTHQDRTYRLVQGQIGRRSVVVLWRDIPGLNLVTEAGYIQSEIFPHGLPDRLYVNGDSHIPGVRPIQQVFVKAMVEMSQGIEVA